MKVLVSDNQAVGLLRVLTIGHSQRSGSQLTHALIR
jgi:hypothetical protein